MLLTSAFNIMQSFWQVSMDDVRVHGDKILKNVNAVFDTGSSVIYGDRKRVAELYGRIGGTLVEHAGNEYYYREF
jgi:hypothetical protein